eukprot:4325545-Amphidinium_carterae.1
MLEHLSEDQHIPPPQGMVTMGEISEKQAQKMKKRQWSNPPKLRPSVAEQIELDPFGEVIRSQAIKSECGGQGMLAVHTTRADLYTRLWCVYEVAFAKKEKVQVRAAFSSHYVEQTLDRMQEYRKAGFDGHACKRATSISCSTASAQCSK